jgi:hypothetical protein
MIRGVMAATTLRLLLAGLVAGVAAGAQPQEPGLLDLEGRPVAALPAVAGETAVFVFTATDCPLANRYAPELRRIHGRFAASGVRFFRVYVDPKQPADAIRRHDSAFDYGFPALLDPGHGLVRLAGANVTPEVAVFVGAAGGPRLVYRGRIDDRNVAFGRTRPEPKSRDLEDVLAALGSGQDVPDRTTNAVGCTIPPLE